MVVDVSRVGVVQDGGHHRHRCDLLVQEVANSATAKREELEAALAEAQQAAETAAVQVADLQGKVAAAEAARDDANRHGQKLQQRIDVQKCVRFVSWEALLWLVWAS